MKTHYRMVIVLCTIAAAAPVFGAGGGSAATEEMAVSGVFGLRPATQSSAVAAWIEIPEDKALAGIRWYNNDGMVVFPGLYVAAGDLGRPPALGGATLCGTDVVGLTSGWSSAEFEQPVSGGGVYVMLRIPEGSVQEGIGAGGGAGLGYTRDGQGCPGWITSDGEDWMALSTGYRLAIEPILVSLDGQMLVLNKSLRPDPASEEGQLVTGLSTPAPNPFNPQTTIQFSLARAGQVELTIYDLQGRRVRTLARGSFERGRHTVVWLGDDESGRRQASGVYLVSLQADGKVQTRRLALIK